MGKEVRKEKKKISRSGRLVIRPKKLRTTSSDEGLPRKKRSKGQITVRKEFERLRQSGKDVIDNDEPRQFYALSKQLIIPKNCNMTTIENSKKNYSNNYSAKYNQLSKCPKDTIQIYNATSASTTAVPIEAENSTPERNDQYIANSDNCIANTIVNIEFDTKLQQKLTKMKKCNDNYSAAKYKQLPNSLEAECATNNGHFIIDTAPIIDTEMQRKLTQLPKSPEDECVTNNSSFIVDSISAAIIDTQVLDELKKLQQLFTELVNGQADIKKQLKEIKEKISDDDVTTKTFYQPLDGYPLKTMEEFYDLEHESKKLERQKLYHYIVGLGGAKLRDFIYTAIKQTMTDELVNKFTWLGDENYEKLQDTKMMNLIYHAAKKCSHFEGPPDKEAYKKEILQVLRTIKQRYRRTRNDKDKDDEDEEENSDSYSNESTE